MTYSILREAGLECYTNTDSLSEFNTLIDPMVATQIAELPDTIEAMVLEISEVQGWEDRIMENHAFLMTRAINPKVIVLTNVALDHLGLVNSLEDAYQEISSTLKNFSGTAVVLNADDPLIMKMRELIPPTAKIILFGKGGMVECLEEGIYLNGDLILPKEDLPFQSPHFIQNTTAAIATATTMEIGSETIKNAIKSYKPLKRRFNILKTNPIIVDDFAHNPDGIRATIKSASALSSGQLHVVSAIRGSRGEPINQANAMAVAQSLKNLDYTLILSSSQDVVDQNNLVKPDEKKVFIYELQKEGIIYTHYKNLHDALKEALHRAHKSDTILLIGAQGMDPASNVLNEINNK
jgi:UDP-N-acetylmuramoyl-L-alanyl-D-glutamate--2,6-diaminopimelate ligase